MAKTHINLMRMENSRGYSLNSVYMSVTEFLFSYLAAESSSIVPEQCSKKGLKK
jgi:hypothetical protein